MCVYAHVDHLNGYIILNILLISPTNPFKNILNAIKIDLIPSYNKPAKPIRRSLYNNSNGFNLSNAFSLSNYAKTIVYIVETR